jgi:signal transduction histidine kinase
VFDIAEFAELKASVVRSILVRRMTLGVFTVVALGVLIATRFTYLNPAMYAPLVWFALTFPFKLLIDRQRTARSLHRVHVAFFVAEIALITVLVHMVGGSEWIGNVFYLFTVIYANAFLPPLHGAWVTGLVVAFYAGLVLLEYAGVIPHRSLVPVFGEPARSLTYNVTTVLAGTAGVYAVVAFTIRTFNGIYARKNRVLAARESELAEMSRRLLTAQDEERRRIARSLHDGLIQSLAALKLHLVPARERLGEEAHRGATDMLDEAIRQTRTLAYSIRPPLLDDLGLVPSLERLAETVSEEAGVEISVASTLEERLDLSVESLLFFVAQEALQNVVRHACAESVDIVVERAERVARLSIRDDGVGFRREESRGLGLRGIEERLDVTGGRMTLETAPGRGTSMVVEVPHDGDSRGDRR